MEVLGVDNLGFFDCLRIINHKRSQSTWKREHRRSWGNAKSPIFAILDSCWLAQSISELDSYQQDINHINSISETASGSMINTDFFRLQLEAFFFWIWFIFMASTFGSTNPSSSTFGINKESCGRMKKWLVMILSTLDYQQLIIWRHRRGLFTCDVHIWKKAVLFVCASLTSQTVS